MLRVGSGGAPLGLDILKEVADLDAQGLGDLVLPRGRYWGLSRPHCREDRRLPRLILSRPPELMTEAEREAFVFDLRMARRQVAPETWRDLDTRRLPVDDLVEKIVARKLLEHLLLCRWAIERLPTPGLPPSR